MRDGFDAVEHHIIQFARYQFLCLIHQFFSKLNVIFYSNVNVYASSRARFYV